MRYIRFVFIALGLIILIGVGIYFYKELKPKTPVAEKEKGVVEETKEFEEATITNEYSASSKKPKLLLEKYLLYPEIDYPYIYAYDPESRTIKELNLEDKTYKEFYKSSNITFLSFSKDKTKILFKKDDNYYVLDTITDNLERLPASIKKVFWFGNNLFGYLFTENSSQIVKIKNGIESFIDLYIFHPEFDELENSFIVFENLRYTDNSPLILITNKKEKKVLLENALNLSAITNKKNLIFVSLFEGSWKSYLIDKNGTKLKEFNFGTLKEKCTFEKILVCGVPLDQSQTDLSKWYYYKISFQDRLVIFDPDKNKLDYYDLNGKYDVLRPKLTPLGIIFLNRFDNKIYVVPTESSSF